MSIIFLTAFDNRHFNYVKKSIYPEIFLWGQEVT